MPTQPYDPVALERDIARHDAEKRNGVPDCSVEEARSWLRRERMDRARAKAQSPMMQPPERGEL